jgi:hypothetical protein
LVRYRDFVDLADIQKRNFPDGGSLGNAEALRAVDVLPVFYSGGYGFDVCPGPKASPIQERAKDWLAQYQPAIDWVIQEFGACTAAELELLSTIIYVDREFVRDGVDLEELAQRVRGVKPQFTETYVVDKTKFLLEKDLLTSVRRNSRTN